MDTLSSEQNGAFYLVSILELSMHNNHPVSHFIKSSGLYTENIQYLKKCHKMSGSDSVTEARP